MVNQTKQEFRKQKLLVLEVQSIRAGPSPVGAWGVIVTLLITVLHVLFLEQRGKVLMKGTDE